jgi:Leucine-rich repeat (LRR) protein
MIEYLIFGDSGLSRIQSNAFADATNVRELQIRECLELTTVEAKAFKGMINLRRLDLTDSAVETIHEEAFDGLITLRELSLANNRIRRLPANVFRTMIALESLVLRNNFLESLDGRLLASNRQIVGLQLADNQINAIQKNFLDNTLRLVSLNMLGNICADNFWTIQGQTTLEIVRQDLKNCFNNFVEVPGSEVKTFKLKLRGSLTIRNEDGSEVIRI